MPYGESAFRRPAIGLTRLGSSDNGASLKQATDWETAIAGLVRATVQRIQKDFELRYARSKGST